VQNLFRRWKQRFQTRAPNHYPIQSSAGRVSLQPLTRDEICHVECWFKDRDTCELAFGVKAPWDVLSTIREEYLEELQKDKVGVLSVRLDSFPSAPPIGFVRYKLFSKGRKKQARVGILLGPTEHRGKGLGQEAFSTLLDYLFQTRDVQLIELDTAVFNEPAQKCFRRCGFSVLREMEFQSINAQWTERRLVMRLTKDEWTALSS
jgi:RimJ/RimL family protein N-acetyltransferase